MDSPMGFITHSSLEKLSSGKIGMLCWICGFAKNADDLKVVKKYSFANFLTMGFIRFLCNFSFHFFSLAKLRRRKCFENLLFNNFMGSGHGAITDFPFW
jgi:hypothetical protein